METMANIEERKERLKLDYAKMTDRNNVERERISTNKEIADNKIEADIVEEVISTETKLSEEQSRERIENAKVGAKIAEIISREDKRQ